MAKVVYNDKILNGLSWFMKIGGITIWPWIILREKYQEDRYKLKNEKIIRHESTHIKQEIEMLIIPFYIWYILEFIVKLFRYGGKAYSNLSFEREAKANENDLEYLKNRKLYSWFKYL